MEKEKTSLFAELESLRKMGEKRTSALENEVFMLRKEVAALEKLLHVKEKIPNKEGSSTNLLHRNQASS